MDARRDLASFVTGIVLVLIGGLAFTRVRLGELSAVQSSNDALSVEVQALSELIAGHDLEQERDELELRLESIATLRHNPIPTWLIALEAALPVGAWLTSLELADGRMNLQGTSEDPLGAASLMEALQLSECFGEVGLRSVEASPQGQEFWLTATTTDIPCASGTPGGRPLFRSPALQAALRPQANAHPLQRWEPRDYDLVAVEAGLATLRDPEDGLHRVMVGSSVGLGAAVVKFVTDDSLILTEDEVVDRDTGRARTNITTLTLVE